jgi:BioD-like phosphotransacetylase family protein
MTTIYVASTEAFAGKTSLAIGLGKHFQRKGYAVGYIKPLTSLRTESPGTSIRSVRNTARVTDKGLVARKTRFVCQELGLNEALEDIAPIAVDAALIERAIRAPQEIDYRARLLDAYGRASAGKDVVLVEGGDHPLAGSLIKLAAPSVIELLDASVIVVLRYNDCRCIDIATGLHTYFGPRLMGVVVNAVPRRQMRFVQETARPLLEQRGVPVLAVLPEERLLSSISVQELVEQLHGEVVCCEHETDELVEYLMVGAMTAGSAITYFRSRPNKAVITGGDRHDVQLAALETSTRCLILTGNQPPSQEVLDRANEVGVPIIVVEPDTLSTVRVVERAFGRTYVRQPRKMSHFSTILSERFDFERMYAMLGMGEKRELTHEPSHIRS